jgi:hypothetical protein
MLITILKNLLRTRSPVLAVLATAYEVLGHRWEGGMLRCSCERPQLNLVIEAIDRGRVVGRLRVSTCVEHDIG